MVKNLLPEKHMSCLIAKRFLENWFFRVWVQSDTSQMDDYYAKFVEGEFNCSSFTRDNLEEHCRWCKTHEKITHFEVKDLIAAEGKIAFRMYYQFIDQDGNRKDAENMGIFHLNAEGKIEKIWVKSSEQFGQ